MMLFRQNAGGCHDGSLGVAMCDDVGCHCSDDGLANIHHNVRDGFLLHVCQGEG